jgi:glutaredoxin 3
MFVVYSKEKCSQCEQAKMILKMKSLPHEVKTLGTDFTVEELAEIAPNARTFPIIFKDGELIGGFAELRKLV